MNNGNHGDAMNNGNHGDAMNRVSTGGHNPMVTNCLGTVIRGLKARVTRWSNQNGIPRQPQLNNVLFPDAEMTEDRIQQLIVADFADYAAETV